MHLVWTVLFIVVFLNQDVQVHKRSLVEVAANDNGKWWTFDEHTKTLLIHADVGQNREVVHDYYPLAEVHSYRVQAN